MKNFLTSILYIYPDSDVDNSPSTVACRVPAFEYFRNQFSWQELLKEKEGIDLNVLVNRRLEAEKAMQTELLFLRVCERNEKH